MLCHRELIAVSSRQHVLINRKHLSQLQGPALQLAESFVNRGGIAQVQGFLTRFARNHPPSVMLEIIDPHYRAGPRQRRDSTHPARCNLPLFSHASLPTAPRKRNFPRSNAESIACDLINSNASFTVFSINTSVRSYPSLSSCRLNCITPRK